MKRIITACILGSVSLQATAVTLLWDAPATRKDDSPITGTLTYQVTTTPLTEVQLTATTGDELCVVAIETTSTASAVSDSVCAVVPSPPLPPTRLRLMWEAPIGAIE